MKFTKQQLLDSLKAKLTENGKRLSISERTIKSLCDSHYDLLVNEETELNDLVGKILPQYVSLNGNYEKDNADFIKKWNDEHPTPITKPTKAHKMSLPKPKRNSWSVLRHWRKRMHSMKQNDSFQVNATNSYQCSRRKALRIANGLRSICQKLQ